MTLLMIFFLLPIVCLWALIFFGKTAGVRALATETDRVRAELCFVVASRWWGLSAFGATTPKGFSRSHLSQQTSPTCFVLDPTYRFLRIWFQAIAAAECDFVSVFVFPKGGFVGRYWERLMRDFAQPRAVNDVRHSAAFADVRCFWFRPDDLDLPANGENIAIKLARARKHTGFL